MAQLQVRSQVRWAALAVAISITRRNSNARLTRMPEDVDMDRLVQLWWNGTRSGFMFSVQGETPSSKRNNPSSTKTSNHRICAQQKLSSHASWRSVTLTALFQKAQELKPLKPQGCRHRAVPWRVCGYAVCLWGVSSAGQHAWARGTWLARCLWAPFGHIRGKRTARSTALPVAIANFSIGASPVDWQSANGLVACTPAAVMLCF